MAFQKLNIGDKVNSWTIIGRGYFISKSGKSVLKWKCKCDCGTKALVAQSDLNSNKSTRCRKCNKSLPVDLSGQVFGQWTVLSCDIRKLRRRYCECECSCGSKYVVCAQTLSNGTSTRCANCYHDSRDVDNHTSHPLYGIWRSMHNRCELKSNSNYNNYGKRGITVCKRWDSFESFVNDMSPRHSKRHSLDRIDNCEGYSPENCRWATSKQQCNNKRNNHLETYNGMTKNITQWAEHLNVKVDNFWHFMTRNSFEEAYNWYKDR